jgi:hypothetical protein
MNNAILERVGTDQLDMLVKRVMYQTHEHDPREAVKLVNTGDYVVSLMRRWREKDGIIRFSVMPVNMTGPEWLDHHEEKYDFRVMDRARSILLSSDFKPTVVSWPPQPVEIAVIKGVLFGDTERTTKIVRADAAKRGFLKSNADIAPVIRRQFSDDDLYLMGLAHIVTMHEPISDSSGTPSLLDIDRRGTGKWLTASDGNPGTHWSENAGFAFIVPAVVA